MEDATLKLHNLTASKMKKMNALMKKYQATPMDMADASLVVLAESMRLQQIFTIDSYFYIYRLTDGSKLEVIP
jgi:predicted nucleic acid-binding protein